MVIGDKYISIHPKTGSSMQIFPEALAHCVCEMVDVENTDGTWSRVSNYTVPKAKKICKLIAMYGDEDDIRLCDEQFRSNPKLYSIWMDQKVRFGR